MTERESGTARGPSPRARLGLALVVGLCLLPARPGSAAPDAGAGEFQARVDRSIDRAVAFLRGCWKRPDAGSHPTYSASRSRDARIAFGEDTLVALAVLHGLEGKAFPELPAIVASVRENWRAQSSTYGASLALMLVCAMAEQEEAGRAAGWPDDVQRQRRSPAWLKPLATDLVKTLTRWRTKGGLWGYGPPHGPGADLSNTQFALTALCAARRFGARLERAEVDEIAAALLALQEPDGDRAALRCRVERPAGTTGPDYATHTPWDAAEARARGFHYSPNQWISTSTTSAAVVSLGVLSKLSDGPTAGDAWKTGIRDGLCWMTKNYSATANVEITSGADQLRLGIPGLAADDVVRVDTQLWFAYSLWGVERVMNVLGIAGTGEIDWYRVGADCLVPRQRKDGSWRFTGPDAANGPAPTVGVGRLDDGTISDTAFTLLFLKRGMRRSLGDGDSAKAPDRPTGSPTTPR